MDEICALPCYHAAHSRNSMPTLRDNPSVPSPSVKKSKKYVPKRLVRNYHYTPRNDKEECRFRLLRGSSLKSPLSSQFLFLASMVHIAMQLLFS
jgi:hypothetical protein